MPTRILMFKCCANCISAEVSFYLQQECSGEEGGSAVVHILKSRDIFLAHVVYLTLTPITIEDAYTIRSGQLPRIPPDNNLSPNRAGELNLVTYNLKSRKCIIIML